ncbi:glycerophosphodiester phosphodiesterase [Clostridiaceae bacterium 68-1-5]|uniref:Glycerophosphodiester phosphodiesterase n=1 Tax=Suipraeoptans intestinalis TaxID=2606628 RepID=A0A6N7UTA3_9FIRM|nr:glycerophosphodiester phosphodiesterase family protein [Suipraeoptans intestinalis]MSR94673.1 glycerophosphodiester phosphodiesterase [Suipraeoptans intestinalis]
MVFIFYILFILFLIFCLLAFLAAPSPNGLGRFKALDTRYFAHRGLHTKDRTVAENSLEAFALACERGYGIELDVQLSKDGKVVVFHDDTLKRVCGIDKRVDQLTYEELRNLKLHQTKSNIPLFSEVLALVNGRTALIVELKTGRNNPVLCRKTLEHLRRYEGKYCIESFDPRIVAWFKKHAENVVRGQLAAPVNSYGESASRGVSLLMSFCLLNFMGRPDFIAYKNVPRPLPVRLSELMGAAKVCWTSRQPHDNAGNTAEIFEFYEPEKTCASLIQPS